MKKIAFGLVLLSFSGFSFPAYVVDLYGTEKKQANQILKTFSHQIIEIESALNKEREASIQTGKGDLQKISEIEARKEKLEETIKKEGRFLYTHFHTTTYPSRKDKYTTIEVVTKNNPERLAFIVLENKNKKYSHHADLIEKMREYDALGMQLAESNQLNTINTSCSVYHCLWGFSHPRLSPYLKIFNRGIIKEKTQILNILNQDPDGERRAAAAFLIGHFENPEEIISILSQHLNDKEQIVRNNVIRVIGATMEKARINHINPQPFLNLLKSPYGTDRNKALIVLVNASSDEFSRDLIIGKGRDDLLALLQLKQPNNHDWTYLLLKKISGKNYSQSDIGAWRKWFSKMKKDGLNKNALEYYD